MATKEHPLSAEHTKKEDWGKFVDEMMFSYNLLEMRSHVQRLAGRFLGEAATKKFLKDY